MAKRTKKKPADAEQPATTKATETTTVTTAAVEPAATEPVYRKLQDWAAADGIKILDPDGFDRVDPDLWNHEYTEEAYREGIKGCTTEPLAATTATDAAPAPSPVVAADTDPAVGEAVAATMTMTQAPSESAMGHGEILTHTSPIIDPETWVLIHKAREYEKSCEARVEAKKKELKGCNEKLTEASARVRELLDNAILSEPSLREEYERAAKVKKVADKPTCLPPAATVPGVVAAKPTTATTTDAVPPEAWRTISVDDLGLPMTIAGALHAALGGQNGSSKATVGALADYTGTHELTDIEFIDEAAAAMIEEKLTGLWTALGIKPPLAAAADADGDASVEAMQGLGAKTRERFEWIGMDAATFDSDLGLQISNATLVKVLGDDPRAADLATLWGDPNLTASDIEGWTKAIADLPDAELVKMGEQFGVSLLPRSETAGQEFNVTDAETVQHTPPADAAPTDTAAQPTA